jgi:hypothetical protein
MEWMGRVGREDCALKIVTISLKVHFNKNLSNNLLVIFGF